MNIDEKLVEILRNTFPDWSVSEEDWFSADRAIEKMKPPFIIYLLPTSGQMVRVNGRTKDWEEIGVAFLDHVPRDANGHENIETYNRMKDAARQFVSAINADGSFQPVELYNYQTIYEELADITTGILLTATIRELRGECE